MKLLFNILFLIIACTAFGQVHVDGLEKLECRDGDTIGYITPNQLRSYISASITQDTTLSGDVGGGINSTAIGAGKVTAYHIVDGGVTGIKINSMGAATNQGMKWNGLKWIACDLDTSKTNEIQTLSILAGKGTLKLTNPGSASTFVQLADSSATNEIQTLSILAGKGTLKLTNPGSASTFVQLADSSATNEIQTLSILAGKGTLKLTNPGSASTFVQLADSSATNEIELPTQTGQSGKYLTTDGSIPSWSTIASGSVTSVAATAPAAGFTISGSPITSSGTLGFTLANDLSALEGLSSTGYAVRTATDTWVQRTFGVSAGQLTVTNNTGVAGNTSFGLATTAVTAGTYGSSTLVPSITVDAYGRLTGVTTSAISTTGLKWLKANSDNNRLGLEVTTNVAKDTAKVGFNYSSLSPYTSPVLDTNVLIPLYNPSGAINSSAKKKYLIYNAYAEAYTATPFTLSCVSTIDSTVRLDVSPFTYLFDYSKATGELTYKGGQSKVFKIDASITTTGTINLSDLTLKIKQKVSGTYSTIYTDNALFQKPASTPYPAHLHCSKLIVLNPGDKIKLTMSAGGTQTMTIVNGYINITATLDSTTPP